MLMPSCLFSPVRSPMKPSFTVSDDDESEPPLLPHAASDSAARPSAPSATPTLRPRCLYIRTSLRRRIATRLLDDPSPNQLSTLLCLAWPRCDHASGS